MSIKTNVTATLIAIATAGTASATTIDPNDFDLIRTESNRTETTQRVDISGNGAFEDNGGIGSGENAFNLGDFPSSTLLAGRVALSKRGIVGQDEWVFDNVTGGVEISLADFGRSRHKGFLDYGVTFSVLIDGVVAASQSFSGVKTEARAIDNGFSFGTFNLVDQSISFLASGTAGAIDYDVTISAVPDRSVEAVPLPAGGLLLLTGLAGLAAARRRKQG